MPRFLKIFWIPWLSLHLFAFPIAFIIILMKTRFDKFIYTFPSTFYHQSVV